MAIRKIISRSIGTDVIAAEDLAANSVTVSEITDGAVTMAKIASSMDFAGKTVTNLDAGGGYYQGETTGGATSNKGHIFRVHEQELNTNVTIASTDNALAAGPLSIANNITLTVSGNLTIV
jgi:hypothetical protein|tara:strand:- start:567 stop:929 length:363 start_codon:yes stop_codon:yes gene_type:complete